MASNASFNKRINYEQLVATYLENLTTVLRGFNSAPEYEFLATWVHDEDDTRSIQNIVEAAYGAGLAEVSIYIGPTTLRRLDPSRLQALVGHFGNVCVKNEGAGIELSVSFTAAAPPPTLDVAVSYVKSRENIKPQPKKSHHRTAVAVLPQGSERADWIQLHPAYLGGLKKVLEHCSHEGLLSSGPESELLRVAHQEATLTALVDPSTHVIRKVAHHGAVSDVQRGLLECLCVVIEGRPIQECSDHAVIRVEEHLRDHSRPRVVSGVVLPENASPAFCLLTRLTRELLVQYRQKTGYNDTKNFHDDPASERWRALSADDRLERLRTAVGRHALGDGVEVVSIQGDKRVVVEVGGEFDSAEEQTRLLELERHLKETIEPTLQLYMEPMMDKNKLRQIKRVEVE